MVRRVYLLISGHVQGVNYRNSMVSAARPLGVAGWVRNLPDGRVEAVAEGKEQALRSLIEWCRQGPSWAAVNGVEEEWSDPTGEFDGFSVKR
ncbi:MAG: acylphosphatase [Clostridia bacterium]|nr:acylphosphatase [Clostridia bacterium]